MEAGWTFRDRRREQGKPSSSARGPSLLGSSPPRRTPERSGDALVLDSARHRHIDSSTPMANFSESSGLRHFGAPGVCLEVNLANVLYPQKSIAELSARRREAIKRAFRRVDVTGQGWVPVDDFVAGLRAYSRLSVPEQAQVISSLSEKTHSPPSARRSPRVTFAMFAGYYHFLSSSIELDRDFEEMLQIHWGFCDVTDILDDMKNNLAMVGLSYALRNSMGGGPLQEVGADAFQSAMSSVGLQYSEEDLRRVFAALSPLAGEARSVEVRRLTETLTSAPRPSMPIPQLFGAAQISEVNSESGSYCPNRVPTPGKVLMPPKPQANQALPEVVPTPPAMILLAESEPPETAPPEHEEHVEHHGAVAPPERDPDGHLHMEDPPLEAPLEEDHPPLAPPEKIVHDPREEAPKAPQERDINVAAFSQPGPASPVRPGAAAVAGPVVPVAGVRRRRAVTVGINYIGLPCKLSGCINDSHTFIELLTDDFGFDVGDIRQLRDDHPQGMPTRRNITTALRWLVNGAAAGDHLFFHYSGHGSQQDDRDGDEMDGKDETLVPCDYQQSGMLSDDELRSILVQGLPQGVRLTVILDCCHSGTALDLPYKVVASGDGHLDVKKKALHKTMPASPAEVVLLSGCRDDQTSADAGVGLAGNTSAAGAMTTAFRVAISRDKGLTYSALLSQMRQFLVSQRFSQVPQLSSEQLLNLEVPFMPEARTPAPPPPVSHRPPARKALSIGINYLCLPPNQGQLSGCINDSDTMVGVLKDVFRFQDKEICRLRDDRHDMMPTKQNMLASFRWLTNGAAPGDELFLHYSGHGGRQKDANGDEESGFDDTLIPCDFQTAGQIVDDELYANLVQNLPRGCRFWVILDCCHSGTALDLPYKVSVGPDGKATRCVKAPSRRPGGAGSEADVIMISGCQDDQTSADVQAGSMGVARAAGAMTTAFKRCITPAVSCHDLLLGMRAFLKQNGFAQVPQMSSEQFVKLDSSYVRYGDGAEASVVAAGGAAPGSPGKPPSMAYAPPVAPQQQQGQSYVPPISQLSAAVAALHGPPAQQPASARPPAVRRRRAVTVGINYIGLQCQLAGCINDSHTFVELLTEDFGFNVADIRQLRDDHPQGLPTRRNITTALRWLVTGASEGDHLFFHYSGHGSQQDDTTGDEMDGKDETLIPVDYQQSGMMSDDELRSLLCTGLPKGVRLTVIMDCCHSGTALDLPYKVMATGGALVVKKKEEGKMPEPCEGDVVLLSGCMDNQTSADAGVGLAGNTKAAGAMTTAFRVAISKNHAASFQALLLEMRSFLVANRMQQVPQLSSEQFLNLEAPFMPEARAPDPPPPVALRPPVRRAVSIGINYLSLPPNQGRLSGCINDSDTIIGLLRSVFRFEDSQIRRLRDDTPGLMPTRKNMMEAFRWLTGGASVGDEMFLHYSGHGGRQKDANGDEATGMDDTLIPCDFQTAGQIVDDDLYATLVQSLPRGCKLWVILDCCHSGTALDLPYKINVADGGKSVTCVKAAARHTVAPATADVIMISGCEDTQTSADIQGGAMGVARAAGAMTTAFKRCLTPTVSCIDLLLNMRKFLKQHRYEQVPQMSSEQFLQLDSPFVSYAARPATPAVGAAPSSPSGGGKPPGELDARISSLQQQIQDLRIHHHGHSVSHQGSPHTSPLRPGGHHAHGAHIHGGHHGGFGAHAGAPHHGAPHHWSSHSASYGSPLSHHAYH